MDAAAVAAFCAQAMQDILPGAEVVPPSNLADKSMRIGSMALENMALGNLPFEVRVPQQNISMPLAAETKMLLWALAIAAAVAVFASVLLVVFASLLAERRSAFVSAVTHELRTPLTALRLHADLLADERVGSDAQRRHKAVATLRDSGTRLATLIDNVLDYARLERRRAPQNQAIAIAELCRREQQRWEQRLAQSGLQLQLSDHILSGEACVRGDADGLVRILDNLIDNACKYAQASDPAEVRLSMSCEGNTAIISLRDFGPGLPQGKLPKPGERSAEQAAGHAPGIGLGLELCRRLAKSMGGRLTLHSQDPGLQVELELPVCEGPQ